ncbi:MAG: hypothetical protein IT374_17840 [Polyangiaceae bacterium]|nr:hypothetical protein [Polyangiaceae bacterium]
MQPKLRPPNKRPPRPQSGPEITYGEAGVGRSTLAEIESDLASEPWPRAPLITASFEGRGSAPRVRRALSAPEIEIREAKLGRESLAAIDEELREPPPPGPPRVHPLGDALELRTFVVEEAKLSLRSSDAERRAFVRERLAHRLPALSRIRRIDTKLLEPGAVVLRIWCAVD